MILSYTYPYKFNIVRQLFFEVTKYYVRLSEKCKTKPCEAHARALDYQTVKETTNDDTSSLTYVDIDPMNLTVPSGKPGACLIIYSMNIYIAKPKDADREVHVRLVKDSTQLTAGRVIREYASNYSALGLSLHWIGNLSVGDVIKAQWHTPNADAGLANRCSAQPTIYYRMLSLIKIA